jgi:hypothetical protein
MWRATQSHRIRPGPEVLEGQHVTPQERFLGLGGERNVQGFARVLIDPAGRTGPLHLMHHRRHIYILQRCLKGVGAVNITYHQIIST